MPSVDKLVGFDQEKTRASYSRNPLVGDTVKHDGAAGGGADAKLLGSPVIVRTLGGHWGVLDRGI